MIINTKLFIALTTIVLFFSCNIDTKKVQKSDVVPNKITKKTIAKLEKMEFKISGMTCEIGCARLIQSKLSKKEGVKTVKVSFKDSLGNIEFNSNVITQKDIISFVNNIAGGDLYKVTDSKKVDTLRLVN